MPSSKILSVLGLVVIVAVIVGAFWFETTSSHSQDSESPAQLEAQHTKTTAQNDKTEIQNVVETQKAENDTSDHNITLIPHKALYKAKLEDLRSGSQVMDVYGKIYYEINHECDAWLSENQFDMVYHYTDGPAVRVTSDFSNFEAFDGSSFDFNVTRKRNGALYQEIRGQALMEDADNKSQKGNAVYRRPAGFEQSLPAGTLFPTAHTHKVLEEIKAGKKFYTAIVFDGGDEEGPAEINSFYLGPVDYASVEEVLNLEESEVMDTKLLKSPAHKLRLAFFKHDEPEEKAEYEMTLILHENGIISDMMIDYEGFSISQKLIALESGATQEREGELNTCE